MTHNSKCPNNECTLRRRYKDMYCPRNYEECVIYQEEKEIEELIQSICHISTKEWEVRRFGEFGGLEFKSKNG